MIDTERLNQAPTSELIELEMLEDRLEDEERDLLKPSPHWLEAMLDVLTPLWQDQLKKMREEGQFKPDGIVYEREDLP